jgi:RimJ/RimL family protein N-acetyltransferase
MTHLPILTTARLRIRPFIPDDLLPIQQVCVDAGWSTDTPAELDKRARWLEWTLRNYTELAALYQPPYGDRAIERLSDGAFVGSIGFVPCLLPLGQLAHYQALGITHRYALPEVGLFWALLKAQQGQGYATEAAQALIEYAFTHLHLKRIIATTEYDNEASQAVMRRLGMTIERNQDPEPPYLQIVGILEQDAPTSEMDRHG